MRRLVKVPLSQNEFDALVSLGFNIGEGNFASSTVLRLLNAGQRRKAARAFMLWIKAESPLQVLPVRRRRAEMAMFLNGIKDPVRYTDEERHLMNVIRAQGISERRRLRARDWLKARAALLQRRARGGSGPEDQPVGYRRPRPPVSRHPAGTACARPNLGVRAAAAEVTHIASQRVPMG